MATNKPTSKKIDGVAPGPESVQNQEVQPVESGYQQQYQPDHQQYAASYQNPDKGKAKWLTLEYGLAMGSIVLSVLLTVSILVALFGGWSGNGAAVGYAGTAWALGLFSLFTVTPGTALVTSSVAAVLLAVLGLVLFGRVSRAIREREGYTKRIAYKVITYGAFVALVLPALALVAKMIGILVSSLLFIGVPRAGDVYKSLYLAEFLPYLLGLGLLAVAAMFIGRIIKGENKSKIVSLVVLGVASAALIASAITVAIQVRDTGSSRSYRDYSSSLETYLPRLDLDY